VAMNSTRLLHISTVETKLKIQTPIFDSIDGKYRKAANRKEKTIINKIKGFHQSNCHFQTMNGNERHLEMPNIVDIFVAVLAMFIVLR
jgi:hypothetical protein